MLINPAFNVFPIDFMKLSPTAKSSNIWRLARGPELVHFWIDSSTVNEVIHRLCGKCPSMEVKRLRERRWYAWTHDKPRTELGSVPPTGQCGATWRNPSLQILLCLSPRSGTWHLIIVVFENVYFVKLFLQSKQGPWQAEHHCLRWERSFWLLAPACLERGNRLAQRGKLGKWGEGEGRLCAFYLFCKIAHESHFDLNCVCSSL